MKAFFDRKRIVEDRRYRALIFAVCGLIFNLLYAAYNGVLGIITGSYWFRAVFAYHIILSVMRFCAILKKDSPGCGIMRLTGVLLSFLSIVLAGIVCMSLLQERAAKYGEIVMITIATYTFYKITMSVIRAVKYRSESSPAMVAIRSIGYAEVAVSILTMQMSMLVSFGEMESDDIYLLNLLTGIGVCVFTLILGVIMLKIAKRREIAHGKIKACRSE